MESEITIDWSRIDELISVLKPIYIFTKELQSQDLLAGDLLGKQFACNYHLKKAVRSGNNEAQVMMDCLEKRMKPITSTLQFEAVLFFDPRFLHQSRKSTAFSHERLTEIVVCINCDIFMV